MYDDIYKGKCNVLYGTAMYLNSVLDVIVQNLNTAIYYNLRIPNPWNITMNGATIEINVTYPEYAPNISVKILRNEIRKKK